MWITSWTTTIFSISCSNSKWQYTFSRKISERYFIVKKNKNFVGPYSVWNNWYPVTHWSNCFSILMKVLRWSRTIFHLFLRICCIVDDIVDFIWMRGCIKNYLHPVCAIDRYQLKQKKKHLYMIALFSIHFIRPSTSFFFQLQNSVYIFPHISPSRSLYP